MREPFYMYKLYFERRAYIYINICMLIYYENKNMSFNFYNFYILFFFVEFIFYKIFKHIKKKKKINK